MTRLALQIAVLAFNVYLITLFSRPTEVMASWQRYICLGIGIADIIAVVKGSILVWLAPYWRLLEELTEWLGQEPVVLMIINGLSLLIFAVFILGRIFGEGSAPGFGLYLAAAVAPAVSFYYGYALHNDDI